MTLGPLKTKLHEVLKKTWLGGLLMHCILVPLWVGCPLPFAAAAAGIAYGGTLALLAVLLLTTLALLNAYTFAYRPWLMRLFNELNMASFYKTCELRGALDTIRTEKTLFCFHPHGVLSVGFVVNGCWSREFHERASTGPSALIARAERSDPLPGPWQGTVFLIAHSLRAWTAFFKVLCDVSGRLESATGAQMERLLSAGRNVAIIPGGFEDATLHKYGAERTAMRSRKGIVKFALRHGYALQPLYTFGESETYYTFAPFLNFRLWLNKFGIPAVIFWGEPRFPLFPRSDVRAYTFVGRPLQLPRLENPTRDEINEWHGRYLTALRTLFDAHKAECGKPDAELEIW